MPLILLLGALVGFAHVACAQCTFESGVDYYIPDQGSTGTADNATDCCLLCSGRRTNPSPVLPPPRPIAPYFTFDTNGNNCYCKPSMGQRKPGQGAHLTSGTCSAAPTPPPTPQSIPNFHACVSELARAQPYCNATLSYADRAASLVASLTLDEKVSRMYSCVDTCDTCPCPVARVGLPAFAYLLEANTAVAATCLAPDRCATVFPGPLGLGGSFNATVWRQKGTVLGTEVRAFNNGGGTRGLGPLTGLAAFGPNINIVRDPRFGRNSELPGEDPYLNGRYAVEMVRGMRQLDSAGHPLALAYLKHYTAYSRETDRGHDTYKISAFDFAESYLPQYEAGMTDGGADGVMCSYNGENGAPSCANGWLLNDVLRTRWQRPDAVVVSDGGAVLNLQGAPVHAKSQAAAAAMALNNGTDVNDGHGFAALADAIGQNLTTEAAVDAALTRSLTQLFKVGLFDDPSPSGTDWTQAIGVDSINSTEHQRVRHEAALQSIVLLRNGVAPQPQPSGHSGEPLLPLRRGASSIAVVGPQAEARSGLLSDYASEQPCFGGGDACIVSIADAIRSENDGANVTSAQGVEVNSPKAGGISAALAVASAADVVVLALGIDKSIEGEGHDRPGITLPGLQQLFADKVLALGKPTVVVLTNGGALAIDKIVADDRAAAIIEAFNPCTNGATALAQLLFGRANRWGKLPVTMYPASYADEQDSANFDMSKSPGRTYKYYNKEPLFKFGHGLSLTTFNLSCALHGAATFPIGAVECEVRNTGPMDGDEVVMVFHSARADVRASVGGAHPVPAKALVAFERVRVSAGGTTRLNFALSAESLQLVNATGGRELYKGGHELIFSRGHGADVIINVTV